MSTIIMNKLGIQIQRDLFAKLKKVIRAQSSVARRPFRSLAVEAEGAQLLEFALVLPLLLVFVVGIIEFGGAFALKQKMTNAAREGARVMVSNSLSDTDCSSTTTPCSVQWAAGAVATYMTNDGMNSSCISPGSPTSSGTSTNPDTWTYSCSSGISLTINHNYTYSYTPTDGGTPVQYTGTQVTLTYPYSWFFNSVMKLLVPGSNLALPTRLTESTVMQNIAN